MSGCYAYRIKLAMARSLMQRRIAVRIRLQHRHVASDERTAGAGQPQLRCLVQQRPIKHAQRRLLANQVLRNVRVAVQHRKLHRRLALVVHVVDLHLDAQAMPHDLLVAPPRCDEQHRVAVVVHAVHCVHHIRAKPCDEVLDLGTMPQAGLHKQVRVLPVPLIRRMPPAHEPAPAPNKVRRHAHAFVLVPPPCAVARNAPPEVAAVHPLDREGASVAQQLHLLVADEGHTAAAELATEEPLHADRALVHAL